MQWVIDQLLTIPALAGAVHGAAKLADLIGRGGFAQGQTSAFVLPLGLRGGKADAATGLYRQPLDRVVGVVLVVSNVSDNTGAAALAELDPLIDAAIGVIVGLGPDDAIGTFILARGQLVDVARGTVTYQLDFALEDQLRISR